MRFLRCRDWHPTLWALRENFGSPPSLPRTPKTHRSHKAPSLIWVMPRSAHPNFLPHIKRTGISEEPAFVTLTNTDKNAGVNYSTHFKKESSGKYGKNSQPEHVFVPVPAQSGGESTGRPNALGTWRHSLLHLSDWGGWQVNNSVLPHRRPGVCQVWASELAVNCI